MGSRMAWGNSRQVFKMLYWVWFVTIGAHSTGIQRHLGWCKSPIKSFEVEGVNLCLSHALTVGSEASCSLLTGRWRGWRISRRFPRWETNGGMDGLKTSDLFRLLYAMPAGCLLSKTVVLEWYAVVPHCWKGPCAKGAAIRLPSGRSIAILTAEVLQTSPGPRYMLTNRQDLS